LATVVELVTPEALQEGVKIECYVPNAPLAAHFDDERIKQVLFNLIRNAVDAAKEETGDVRVRLDRDDEHAIIEVSDSGPGISDNVSIFEPFSSSKEGGTGLGLPIVHRIVSDHGGEISIDRVDGRTVFRIELPLDGPLQRGSAV
jgi:signal transduction histidine kinase